MIHARRIVASCMTAALAAASLLVASPAEASPGVCYITSYDSPLIPGGEHYLVPEYNLSPGMTDFCVTSWQRQINRRYGQVLSVDGIYGPRTRDWTTRIQRSQQYSWCAGGVDGIAGPKTISCFEHVNGYTEWG